MKDLKIGKCMGKYVYLDEDKLNFIAKKYPESYLCALECVAEVLRHPSSRTENEEEIVLENVFGKVVIAKRNGRQYIDSCGFYAIYNF